MDYFKKDPYSFEKCVTEITRMMDKNIVDYELTRRWADGGRDAIGKYRIGNKDSSIYVDIALEAKCFSFSNAVTMKVTSRLISRLRRRQIGILVTASYLHQQAYKEIIEDQHLVIIIASEDIANILKNSGYGKERDVKKWLKQFPREK